MIKNTPKLNLYLLRLKILLRPFDILQQPIDVSERSLAGLGNVTKRNPPLREEVKYEEEYDCKGNKTKAVKTASAIYSDDEQTRATENVAICQYWFYSLVVICLLFALHLYLYRK